MPFAPFVSVLRLGAVLASAELRPWGMSDVERALGERIDGAARSAAAAAVATANPDGAMDDGVMGDRIGTERGARDGPHAAASLPGPTAIGDRVVALGARGCADPAMEAVTLAQVAALISLWPVTAVASYPAEKTRVLSLSI